MEQDSKQTANKCVICLILFQTSLDGYCSRQESPLGVVTTGVGSSKITAEIYVLILTTDIWGFADVEAATGGIVKWIERNNWKGPSVNLESWLVSGHSNGGKSTHFLL